jgi:hypothetical protein
VKPVGGACPGSGFPGSSGRLSRRGCRCRDLTWGSRGSSRRSPFSGTVLGEAFGFPQSWPGLEGFVGWTADAATGLENLGAREYDLASSSFTSPDLLLTPDDPQGRSAAAEAAQVAAGRGAAAAAVSAGRLRAVLTGAARLPARCSSR